MSGKVRVEINPAVWLVPAGALLVALAPLPYGFYTLLRLVVTGAALFLAYSEYQALQRVTVWIVVLAALAILFNPVVPVHLTREIWAPIDIAAAVLFVAHWRHRGR